MSSLIESFLLGFNAINSFLGWVGIVIAFVLGVTWFVWVPLLLITVVGAIAAAIGEMTNQRY